MPYRNAHPPEGSQVDGMLSPGAPPNPASFTNHLGKTHIEMERLQEENFDLKLQLSKADEELGRIKAANKKRRTTVEDLYNFDYEDGKLEDDGTSSDVAGGKMYAEVEDRMEKYRAEAAALKEDKLRAETDARDAERAVMRLEEELRNVKNVATAERRDMQAELDKLESDRIALRAQANAVNEDGLAAREGAEKREHSAQIRMSGLEMQLDATESALIAERKNGEEMRKAVAEAELVEGTLRLELKKVREAADRANRSTVIGTNVDRTIREHLERIANQEELIREANIRYEALRSQNKLRMQAKDEAADHPAGIENAGVELSVPGYDLYEKLVAKVETSGAERNLVISGDGRQKRWREIVLNEMNDSLKDLYRHTEKLESDRATFIEAHCRTLLDRQGRQPRRSLSSNVLQNTSLNAAQSPVNHSARQSKSGKITNKGLNLSAQRDVLVSRPRLSGTAGQ